MHSNSFTMDTYIYAGNLPFDITEDELKSFFSAAGNVVSATLAYGEGPDGGKKLFRGFGFVQMESAEEVEKCIKELNGKELGTDAPRACFLEPASAHEDLFKSVVTEA